MISFVILSNVDDLRFEYETSKYAGNGVFNIFALEGTVISFILLTVMLQMKVIVVMHI